MQRHDIAILYSGGTDSLALYALAMSGKLADTPHIVNIHLLHMLNGMSRFHDFPQNRLEVAKRILTASQGNRTKPDTIYVELDIGRLFQGLWLDHYEDLMSRYDHKNLVCVACKLGMHSRAILYCIEQNIAFLYVGYTKKQGFYPEQTQAFMTRLQAFSKDLGITTLFPLYESLDSKDTVRHLLEDYGLPSTGGGERKCLFCQTRTTATEAEIGAYLDDMLPNIARYIEHKLAGRVKEAAMCFPPGRPST
ncbi:MAG: hypothetical protein ABWK15_02685 [Dissulfuribacterales bacterium]